MPESENKLPRILIVDDDPVLTETFSTWLESEGYVCRSCGSCPAALELLEREDFEIIGIDCREGGIDGLGFVRTIRERKGLRVPYILAATENPTAETIVAAFRAGADDFVRKPVDRIEIWARLHAALRVIALEKELSDRAGEAAIVGMRRGSVRELSEVVATLAHDLRTPLGTLRMAAATLSSRAESRSPELLPTVERIERVSARMAETLDDVVSAFLADDGTSETWAEFDLTGKVQRAVEMLAAAVPEGTSLGLPSGEVRVKGNPYGVRRLVMNLISNALRHSGAKHVDVTLDVERDPAWVRLEVSDDGCGIPETLLQHLGEPMVLSSAARRQEFFVKGTGLGFTICRRIAAQHRGRILVSSGPKGTTVRVWLRAFEDGPARGTELAIMETEFLP